MYIDIYIYIDMYKHIPSHPRCGEWEMALSLLSDGRRALDQDDDLTPEVKVNGKTIGK